MRRQRPISTARPDFLHVSVARRHIDHRPSMQSPPAPPPDYGCFRMYASSSAARPEPDFLHVSWLGWLLIPAASVCMRRRQVETWSELGRPPDPTFCMYLSPVDTSINRPPVRPCKVRPHHRPTMVASVRMRRRQVETWSDPGRPPDPTFCMYLSPVDTSINRPPVRPCKV